MWIVIGIVIGLLLAGLIVLLSKNSAYHTYHGDIPSFFVGLFLAILGLACLFGLGYLVYWLITIFT